MRTLTLVLLVTLAACAGDPVKPPSQYLLRASLMSGESTSTTAASIQLQTVSVAAYLDQPGLVLETGPGEMHAARTHQWAEPLRLSIPRLLANDLSKALDQPVGLDIAADDARRISVHIDELHGTSSGRARLVAYWKIEQAGELQLSGRFVEEQDLARDGYGSLVAAQQQLLRQLATSIAAALAED